MSLRIAVFAYDFPHKKTCEGMLKLWLHGFDVACVIAQPKIKLPIPERVIRVTEKDIQYDHPKKIADRCGFRYVVAPHDLKSLKYLSQRFEFDLGVILGARILSKEVIDLFPKGILNMHPGILPDNRGLDTIEWATLENIPQGVTTHLIDENIDRGILISHEIINTYSDDAPVDVWLRLMSLQMTMMIDALDRIQKGEQFFKHLGKGTYHKYMPVEEQQQVKEKFQTQLYQFAE